MNHDPQKHHRRSYRLQSHDYSSAAAYFVTIVTRNRECFFGDVIGEEMVLSNLGKVADEFFRVIPAHFPKVEIDVHQIMPNHVHGVIVIYDDVFPVGAQHAAPLPETRSNVAAGSLGAIIRSYKSAVSRQVNIAWNITDIWQRNYYDRIIRNENEWQAIRYYILSNPANWSEDENHSFKPVAPT